jgi:hypothetical protein
MAELWPDILRISCSKKRKAHDVYTTQLMIKALIDFSYVDPKFSSRYSQKSQSPLHGKLSVYASWWKRFLSKDVVRKSPKSNIVSRSLE